MKQLMSGYQAFNDNERDKSLHSMNNDKDIEPEQVDEIADWLVETFSSPSSRDFYCKVGWTLPRSFIDGLVVKAQEKGRSPGALFNHLASREIKKLQAKQRGWND